MKKRWIKFRWLPASWGLVGDAYAEAQAHYYYEGEELDRRLAWIRHPDPVALRRRLLSLDRQYDVIDEYAYEIALNELDHGHDPHGCWLNRLDIDVKHNKLSAYEAARMKVKDCGGDDIVLELAMLDVDLDFGKISKNSHDKQHALLKNEPWVAFVDSGFDLEQGIDGVFFELDWTPQWVDYLRLHGYIGKSDEEIVEDWFAEVCRSYSQNLPTNNVALPTTLMDYPMGYNKDE